VRPIPRGYCVRCVRYRYLNGLEMCNKCTDELGFTSKMKDKKDVISYLKQKNLENFYEQPVVTMVKRKGHPLHIPSQPNMDGDTDEIPCYQEEP